MYENLVPPFTDVHEWIEELRNDEILPDFAKILPDAAFTINGFDGLNFCTLSRITTSFRQSENIIVH